MERPAHVGSRSAASLLCVQQAHTERSIWAGLKSLFFLLTPAGWLPPLQRSSFSRCVWLNQFHLCCRWRSAALSYHYAHRGVPSEQGKESQIKAFFFSNFSGIGAMLMVFTFCTVYLSILYLDCVCLLEVRGWPVGLQINEECSPVFSDTKDSQHELMDRWDTVCWLP